MANILSNAVALRIAADLAIIVSEAEKHGTLPRLKSAAIYFDETELRTIIKSLEYTAPPAPVADRAADDATRLFRIGIHHQERADKAEAEIARLIADREWQPIETAPKDGTWVLVWEQYISTKYHPAEVARFLGDRWTNSASKHVPNVAHWMPLPAGPTVPRAEGGAK